MKKVLVLASVASMIDQFNIPNIKLLKDMGYEVHVACNFEKGNTCTKDKIIELKNTLKRMDVNFYQIDFVRKITKLAENLKAYKQVEHLLKKNDYRFIHCHSPIGGVCGRIAGHRTNTKVIYTAHGFHFFKGAPLLNWLLYYPVERWLARYTDVLITINKEDYSRAKKSFKAGRIEYVPGVGIDLEKFNKVEIDTNLKRKEIGLPQNSFVLLSIGELNKNKNHEIVIRALATIKNKHIHYIICGQGQLESYLKNLSNELGLKNQVHLLGFRKDIPEIFRVSDLFVFPSFREGLSVSLMEAMANGIAVVCSEIRGNSDLIQSGEGGYLVKPTEIEGFANYLTKLMSDNKLRKDLGQFNLKKIENFSIENVISAIENIYKYI